MWWDDDDWVTAPEWLSMAHRPRLLVDEDTLSLECGSLIDIEFVRWTQTPTQEPCPRCETARAYRANGYNLSTDTAAI